MTAYSKWAANQSTAKKAPFWLIFEELRKAGGSYTQVWICVGCHPEVDGPLTLYEHVYMGQQFDNLESTFLLEVYMKRISSNHVACPSLSHTISVCQYMLSTYKTYVHIVLKICSGSSYASHLDTIIKFDWTIFFWSEWSVIPRATVCQ